MGWVLNTDLGGSRFRRKSPELGAAEHEEVRGPHGWSLTLKSDSYTVSDPENSSWAYPQTTSVSVGVQLGF